MAQQPLFIWGGDIKSIEKSWELLIWHHLSPGLVYSEVGGSPRPNSSLPPLQTFPPTLNLIVFFPAATLMSLEHYYNWFKPAGGKKRLWLNSKKLQSRLLAYQQRLLSPSAAINELAVGMVTVCQSHQHWRHLMLVGLVKGRRGP